jgi:hypothetical protein
MVENSVPGGVPLMSLPPKQRVEQLFFLRHGKFPDLVHPRTFNEKVQWRKLNWTDPRYVQLADKVEVKKYAAEKIGPRYVVPNLFAGPRLPPLEARTWPMPCVMKANHASGWNIFLNSASDIDWRSVEETTRAWMATPWNLVLCEEWYNRISRQILVEPMLNPGGAPPPDYKCYVFHGRVEFIQVDTDRFTEHKRAIFTRDWRKLSVAWKDPLERRHIPKPLHFAEMMEAAEALADDLDFVRIDFYDLPEGLKFGEMTFSPGSGFQCFRPVEFDEFLGKYWKLDI